MGETDESIFSLLSEEDTWELDRAPLHHAQLRRTGACSWEVVGAEEKWKLCPLGHVP